MDDVFEYAVVEEEYKVEIGLPRHMVRDVDYFVPKSHRLIPDVEHVVEIVVDVIKCPEIILFFYQV